MIADIVAIQNLYGVPADINAGDTVYGYESNVGGYLGQLFAALSGEERNPDLYDGGPVTLTIYDTGGYDRLDLRWDTADQRVDLRPEGISDVLGQTGNLSIARGTLIERFMSPDAVTMWSSVTTRPISFEGTLWQRHTRGRQRRRLAGW